MTTEPSLQEAAIAYAKAKRAVDHHDGEKKGAVFAEKIALWRAAGLELEAAATRTVKGVAA